MTNDEAASILSMACGRLLRLLSRPVEGGDIEAFYATRTAALDAAAILGLNTRVERPNYVQDRLKGSTGD